MRAAGLDLRVAHLALVAAWVGVVLCESVLEVRGLRRPDLRAAAVEIHYWIDLLVELPLLCGVLATGLLLLAGRALDARLAVKIAGAALALAANFACVAIVVARRRGDPARAARRTRLVFATAAAGIPGGLVALWIGLGYAGRLP